MIATLSSGEGADNSIVFEVSADKMRTWQGATRHGEARWHEHEVATAKPVPEFLGPGLTRIELSGIRLDIDRGVIPRDELRKMRRFRDTGVVLQFTFGDRKGGAGYVGDFSIRDVQETWTRIDNAGVLRAAVVNLSLVEYPFSPWTTTTTTPAPTLPPPKKKKKKKAK